MATRRQHIKLGLFLLSVVVLLVLTLVFVGGRTLWRDRDTYYVISNESIAGIDVESAVTLRGVKVGEVSEIRLDRSDFGRVEVVLAVEPDVAVPLRARAYFRRAGFTGQRVIDITGGTTREGTLPPGSIIPRGITTLEGLEDRADQLTTEIAALIEQATAFVTALRELTDAVDPERVDRVLADVETAVGSMVGVGQQLERAVGDGRKGVASVVASVDELAERAFRVLTDVGQAADDLRALLQRATRVVRVNEDDVRATMGHLRRTTRNAEQLSRQLRLRPSLLLRSDPPRERELP